MARKELKPAWLADLDILSTICPDDTFEHTAAQDESVADDIMKLCVIVAEKIRLDIPNESPVQMIRMKRHAFVEKNEVVCCNFE